MSIKSRRMSLIRVSGVSFDVVHCGETTFTLRSALRTRQEFWLFFAPQGRSAGILITISLLFLWIFCPAGPLGGNFDNNFVIFAPQGRSAGILVSISLRFLYNFYGANLVNVFFTALRAADLVNLFELEIFKPESFRV